MHDLGIAHLDLKPLNIVLRDSVRDALLDRAAPASALDPVLVDFGLSGRRLRPGCATANYGAPEVWGFISKGETSDPRPADVYAFACLAYETLTGSDLFKAPSEMAMIAAHISHDGLPDPLASWQSDPTLALLSAWLQHGLRRNPGDRLTIDGLREQLRELRPALHEVSWPLSLAAPHRAA
jgi:serine/threonine protein kinase